MKRKSVTEKSQRAMDEFFEPKKPKTEAAAALGKWTFNKDNLIVFTHNETKNSGKVAAFDMDGTLITTKSGKTFPVDKNDWILWNDKVLPKLESLHNDEGFTIVIFTNQKGMSTGKMSNEEFTHKIESIAKKIGVPFQLFAATDGGIYRKPLPTMWDYFVKNCNGGLEVDVQESVYVGDAAGRTGSKARPTKADHSFADRFFAENIGVPFQTPESFFLGEKNEKTKPIPFSPKEHLALNLPICDPTETVIPSSEQEIVVMVGIPGSGKSTFAKKLTECHGYVYVNRDTLGTWQKCVKVAEEAIAKGKSVVVDNTNPDKETRLRYTAVAKKAKIGCRCFVMNSDIHLAKHNVRYRRVFGTGESIGPIVLHTFNKKFQAPEKSEGFSEVVKINFVPEFDDEEKKKLWSMHLIEG